MIARILNKCKLFNSKNFSFNFFFKNKKPRNYYCKFKQKYFKLIKKLLLCKLKNLILKKQKYIIQMLINLQMLNKNFNKLISYFIRAYETLTNKKKKYVYDNYGIKGDNY